MWGELWARRNKKEKQQFKSQITQTLAPYRLSLFTGKY
jgi:hypothetical protein